MVADLEGNAFAGTEDLLKNIVFDDKEESLDIMNNVGKNETYEVYLLAETLGAIKAYKKIKVSSIVENNEVKFSIEFNFI